MFLRNVMPYIILLVLLAGAGATFVLVKNQPATPTDVSIDSTKPISTATTSEPATTVRKIDEHLTVNGTPAAIDFCGKVYQAKRVFINDVDIVERIAKLAAENKLVEAYPAYKGTGEICRNIEQNNKEQALLRVAASPPTHIEGGDVVYPVFIDDVAFIVNPTRNYIAEVGGPEFPDPGNFGVYIPIGDLK